MALTFTPAPPTGPIFTTSGIDGIKAKAMSQDQIQAVQVIFQAFRKQLVENPTTGFKHRLDNITEMNFKSGMIIGSADGKPRYVHVSVLHTDLKAEYQNIQSKLQEKFHCKKETLNPKILDPNSSTSPVLNTQRTAPRGWVRPSLDLSTLGLNTWFSDKADARFEYYSQQTDSKGAGLNRDGKDPVYIHDEALQFFDKERRNLESKYASVWCSDPNDLSIQTKIAEEARDRAAEFVVFLGGSNGDRLHLYYEATRLAALRNDLDDRLMHTPFEKAMQRKEPAAIPTASMVHRIGAIAETLVGRVRGLCEPGRVDAPASGASSPEGRRSSSSSEADEAVSGSSSDVASGSAPMQGAAPAEAQAEEGAEVGAEQEEFLTNLTGKVAAWQAAETPTPTQAPLKGTELWLSRLTMDQLQKHSRNFHQDHIAGKQAKEGALPLSELIKRVRNEGLDKVFKDNQPVLTDLKSVLNRYNPQNTGFGIRQPFNVKVSQSLIKAAFAHKKRSLFG